MMRELDSAGEFDTIVVGAGSAGAVLAARLSEDAAHRVLLVEAGPDVVPGAEPRDIAGADPRSMHNPAYRWPIEVAGTEARGASPGRRAPMIQARVMGGGSNLMGMNAVRGIAAEYDEWVRMGAAGWGWADVLPYYRKLEHDLDFGGERHGDSGPVTIRRYPQAAYPPLTRAIAAALDARGCARIADLNGADEDGHGPLPFFLSADAARRVSSSIAYLTAAVRARANLTILTDTLAERVVIEDGAARGLVVAREGGRMALRARRVVACGGGIQTPALLMRSGVGPGARLAALGIAVASDLAGVGENLRNHARCDIALALRPRGRQRRGFPPTNVHTWRWSSSVPGGRQGDMQMVFVHRAFWHELGRTFGAISPALYTPYSQGTVRLASADAAVNPEVDFRHGSDPRDLARLVEGMRLARELVEHPAVAPLVEFAFLPRPTPGIVALNGLTRSNAIRSHLMARGLDLAGPLRPMLLRRGGIPLAEVPRDGEALAEVVHGSLGFMFHPSGTCRMGPRRDPLAVTAPDGGVHGVAGLHVCDTALMPTLPGGNTALAAMMIGEKIADALRGR